MIGSSRTLCYPQIGSPNLFCFRALDQICPLTKHIRRVGVCARFAVGQFFWLGVGSDKVAFSPPAHQYPAGA